ncbi:PMT-domain-containing protein [Basidiobolus meristosporus CBS 931.73]|uniref:Dolichyl-phosphate-mannose--protein mannosyltransferase n=1 Tax=Basidiobolus meristosporus CBS 931.73 TaxID=1314790 RepID=A0A1Y1Y3K7_9FUNG|nr:PMT-domain-containing protein [Basidiobolus meristosporus CBS 931.73]|eukprot:ORX92559.1 PMT-domain-containing protein [Basidiobolus meristosporus CBS 931.73]
MVSEPLRQRHAKKPGSKLPSNNEVLETKDVKVHSEPVKQSKCSHIDWIVVLILTGLSIFTHYFQLAKAGRVIWDESHFGKFGSFYLRREFYHDVHPPLGKMLVALGGYLSGYDGSFDFGSGGTYTEGMNYHGMRMFTAFFGMVMVPVAYLTALNFGYTRKCAFLAASMVLLDTTTLVITRFILLDPMLLCFTATTGLALSYFRKHKHAEFSTKWWIGLVATGVNLGLVASVKWIGLFTIAWVGWDTIEELWDKFGDYKMPKLRYLQHWIARAICLIVIPLSIYVACFKIHFAILTRSGKDDGVMSSLFQANLEGSELKSVPLELAYGSVVTVHGSTGLLHSHSHLYPEGSKQQQITTYTYKDSNNEWKVLKPRNVEQPAEEDAVLVKDGDLIRLVHTATQANLHAHKVQAPVSKAHWEASAYGNLTFGDQNDYWYIEVLDDVNTKTEYIRTLTTRFRLRHQGTGCILRTTSENLPAWGYNQGEVACDKETSYWGQGAVWNIEGHVNQHLPIAEPQNFKTSFWHDFVHLNIAMWRTNNGLIPDPDKDDHLASQPYEWPLLITAMRMCSWGDNDIKFWLVGHPFIWWGSILALCSFVGITGLYLIMQQRRIQLFGSSARSNEFFPLGRLLFVGWFLHYFPFFLMGRVTYLHHYFPALYFAIFMFTFLIDFFIKNRSEFVQWAVVLAVFSVTLWVFLLYSPFVFGFDYPARDLANRELLNRWKLYNR